VVLLVAGEPRWIAEDAWRDAVCRLVEDGFTVLHSLDAADSAAWILRLAKRARRVAPSIRTDGPRRLPRNPSAQAEAMLSVVPGSSTGMARTLLAAHGSVTAVAAAARRGAPGRGDWGAMGVTDLDVLPGARRPPRWRSWSGLPSALH